MKLLKYLLFIVLIFLIGTAIYFGTKDGSFDVAESKIMEAPPEVVYNNVKDFKNWEDWGPWMVEDTTLTINYAEKTEGEGASYSWSGEIIGNGSMKTVKVIPNKEIDQKIIFNTPLGDSENDVYWRFEPTDTPGQTKVTWGMRGEQSFMQKVWGGLFEEDTMETGVKSMFGAGLERLDTTVQDSMNTFTIHVDGITEYGGGYFMYNTTASKESEIGEKLGAMLGQVSGYMQQNNIASSGMPFTIYNEMDELNGTVIFSAAIPTRERVIIPEGSPVLSGYMEPVTTLKTTLKGKYEYIPDAYKKAMEYLAKNEIQRHPTANIVEVYATDPGEVPNPADWVTEIYIPVKVPPQPEY